MQIGFERRMRQIASAHSKCGLLFALVLLCSTSGAPAQAVPAKKTTPAKSAPATPAAGKSAAGKPEAAPSSASQSGLPNLTAKDAKADATWSMRAGLNVAALQCQFSPFLMSVPNYNAFLRQHSDELADSFNTMTGYFVRTKGKTGQRAFDSYATRTNQGYATFDAQYSFCEAAAVLARRALAVPKGQFADFAQAELPQFRTSLVAPPRSTTLAPRLEWAVVPTLKDPCPGNPGCAR